MNRLRKIVMLLGVWVCLGGLLTLVNVVQEAPTKLDLVGFGSVFLKKLIAIVGVVVSFVWIVSGVGLVFFRPWARVAAMAVASVEILVMVLAFLVVVLHKPESVSVVLLGGLGVLCQRGFVIALLWWSEVASQFRRVRAHDRLVG